MNKFEHKHLIKWLERDRNVSEMARAKKAIGYVNDNLHSTESTEWYVLDNKPMMYYRQEGKVADWSGTFGTLDPVQTEQYYKDPVQNAIEQAVKELKV